MIATVRALQSRWTPNMKMIVLMFSWLLCATGYDLDLEEVEALSNKPHSRDALLEELQVCPDGC